MTETPATTVEKPARRPNRVLKALLIVGGVLVLLYAGIYALGAATSPHHIYVVTHQTQTTHTSSDIWKILTDYEAYPTWRPSVASAEILPDIDGLPAHRMNFKGGGAAPIVLVTTFEDERRAEIKWQIIDESEFFSGYWTVRLRNGAHGESFIKITEEGTIPMPFVRGMIRLTGTGDMYLRAFLTDLAAKLGEPPRLS